MTKALTKLIERFLAERRKAVQGWAEMTKADFDVLHRILSSLVQSKCETFDGTYAIDWILIDRSKYEMMHFKPVEYIHTCKTEDDLDSRVEGRLRNLQTAASSMGMILNVRVGRRRREAEKEQKSGRRG